MKLYIPEQSDPTSDALPSHPRKVKKWLAALPQANMGEMTRQIFTRLRELNREKMPNKHRLENMETFREPARNIFNHLKKYFINRTLPLPEKSKKIITLNQSLLQEMALGYKIIVYEAANNIDKKIDNKNLGIAITRAIKYQSELLFRASEIYGQIPEGNWYDIHQMYAYAEMKDIHNKPVKDPEHPDSKTTIENAYKHVLLFSLARPTAMRQSDTERVYNKLYEWSKLAMLGGQAEENQINNFFCARVGDDRPPSYLNQHDCETSGKVYTLDTTELVNAIRTQIGDVQKKQETITVGENLPLETLNTLTISWGTSPERRFSRAERAGHIAVAIGLTHAAKTIREGNIPEISNQKANDQYIAPIDELENFSLETISDDFKAMSDKSSGYMTHTEVANTKDNAWDMVAKGKVMTEAFDHERKLVETSKLKLNKEEDDLHWEVVNISAGGYCLRWNSENTSKAQIGELIALHEREPDDHFEWRVGTIRWMQFTRENGLEIGVQIMSPKVIAAKVQRFNRPNELPFECLILPHIKPLNQPMTIILPSHAFKTQNRLNIIISDDKMDIELGERGEHTGSFTQFQFKSTESRSRPKKLEKENENTTRKKDDFDEIWSSL
jgi:hypothetical protein